MSLGAISSQFWVDDVIILSQIFKILRERFHKRIIYLKVPFTFDFHLSINIGTWNTNLDLSVHILGWRRHHAESKLQSFEIMVLKTNTLPQISLYYWLSSFCYHWCMKWKFGPFLTHLWVNEVTTEDKLQFFMKVISETNSSLQSFIKY